MSDGAAAWARATIRERTAWLAGARRAVASELKTLSALIGSETGKPAWEALTGDLMTLLWAMRWHERHAPRLLRPSRPRGAGILGIGTRVRLRREPLGRVAIIATWNYPVQLLGIQLVQALFAGNEVVVKPSEHAPRTQRFLLEILNRGLPPGTLSWTRADRDAGAELLSGERFDHVVFTGSTRVGREVAAATARTLTPTTLELSGCDSAIVLDDADPVLAARAIWHALEMNGGQTCLAPRRALIDRRVYPAFLAALAPLAAGAGARTLIGADAAGRCHALARDAVELGARPLSGVLEPPNGASMRPQAIVDCPAGAELVGGEHFGPVLAVVPVEDQGEALRVHQGVEQHLSVSIFSRDRDRAEALGACAGVTLVTINDCVMPCGHPAVGVGGRGPSGWGVSRGAEGLLAMTRPVYVTTTSVLLRPPTAVPSPGLQHRMEQMLRWLFGGGPESSGSAESLGAATPNTTPLRAPEIRVSPRAASHGHAPSHP